MLPRSWLLGSRVGNSQERPSPTYPNGGSTRVPTAKKKIFSKVVPRPLGMLRQVFLAHFEPVLTEFSPFHHMYAPLCAIRTYLRAVWWSHLELGEGCRLEDIYTLLHPSPLKFS